MKRKIIRISIFFTLSFVSIIFGGIILFWFGSFYFFASIDAGPMSIKELIFKYIAPIIIISLPSIAFTAIFQLYLSRLKTYCKKIELNNKKIKTYTTAINIIDLVFFCAFSIELLFFVSEGVSFL